LPLGIAAVAISVALSWSAGATTPGTRSNFVQVGHSALFHRGMNAAPAIYKHYVYIGSRTDGRDRHPHPGVLVVDVKDPAKPKIVYEIGPPDEGNPGETSRELRVWAQQKLLIVMNFGCSAVLHDCASSADVIGSLNPNFKFYDLSGAHAAHPKLIATYTPSRTPHEMYLWLDHKNRNRALLYFTTPTSSDIRPNLIVTDISQARQGKFPEIVTWNANPEFSDDAKNNRDVRLHSIGVSNDGKRTYLAYLGGGFEVLDTSDLAAGVAKPELTLITPPANSPFWTNQTVHSAVKVPGRNLVVTTDEVYGDMLDPLTEPANESGCPWGWVHLISIKDPAHPKVLGQYRIEENHLRYCNYGEGQDKDNTTFTSYASHNPTLFRNVAIVTWHSGGLQAIDITNPAHPVRAGFYLPKPLETVATEDPALSGGNNKVVAWSYPIVSKGLIYYVDVRNGLYIVKYTGRGHRKIDHTVFREGNSNRAMRRLLPS
jgi:hypothetical protein